MNSEINNRVKEARLAKKLKQGELANLLSIRQSSLSDIENSRVNVSERVISDLVRVINLNEEWLRYGIGEMFATLPEEDELSGYFGDIAAGSDPFIADVVLEYMRLDDDSKQVIQNLFDTIAAKRFGN